MKLNSLIVAAFSILLGTLEIQAQCPIGQAEVVIEIVTDNYGYEGYWQLTPGGNACGNGTIVSGGNNLVGCNGGGIQLQQPGGYGNNQSFFTNPVCYTLGSTYTIHYVDEYGDGGFEFNVIINGFQAYNFQGTGEGGAYTFAVEEAPENDVMALGWINSTFIDYRYVADQPHQFKLGVFNKGTDTVESIQFQYSIAGGQTVSSSASGLSIPNFGRAIVTIPEPWTAPSAGTYNVTIAITGVNGQVDEFILDNEFTIAYEAGPSRPNILDQYATGTPAFTVIANSSDMVSSPTDLDFHPALNRNELWVTNKGTENTGGTTVTIYNAGLANQNSEFLQDGNAWHFMSLPTGIAFSENYNFGTSPGVFNANHQPTNPFTGPTLWSSDPEIYAQPSGGNGSHIDMLHQSPYSQGIAWERDNAFWLVDGYSNDVVRYDFVDDHNPGNDDHSDATIRRYSDVELGRDIQGIVPSHLELDESKTWLYVVDHGNDRVIRMNITTGTAGPAPSMPQTEGVEEYSTITDYTWETVVNTGLQKPCGIIVKGDKMFVSDYATNEIIMYNISSIPAVEVNRIATPADGIMGIALAPDGKICYVDHIGNEVVKISPAESTVGTEQMTAESFSISPNPSNGELNIYPTPSSQTIVEVLDATGRTITKSNYENLRNQAQTLAPGVYFIRLNSSTNPMKWVIKN
jgi:hypothetical protein